MKYLANVEWWTESGEHRSDEVKVYASDENLEREIELARISAAEWAREDRGAARTGEVILLPAWPE